MAPDSGSLTIHIYGEIGEHGVSALAVAQQIDVPNIEEIHVRINSVGGDAAHGIAIYDLLKQSPAKIVVHIAALAASAASIVAMAGDEINIAEGAYIMIHNSWTEVVGDSTALRKRADTLDLVSASMADIYVKRTGLDLNVVTEMMGNERWISSSEAVQFGFATNIEGVLIAACAGTERFKALPQTLKINASHEAPKDKEIKMNELERLAQLFGTKGTDGSAVFAAAREAYEASIQREKILKSLAVKSTDEAEGRIVALLNAETELAKVRESYASLEKRIENEESERILAKLQSEGRICKAQIDGFWAGASIEGRKAFAASAPVIVALAQSAHTAPPSKQSKPLKEMTATERAQLKNQNPELYTQLRTEV